MHITILPITAHLFWVLWVTHINNMESTCNQTCNSEKFTGINKLFCVTVDIKLNGKIKFSFHTKTINSPSLCKVTSF